MATKSLLYPLGYRSLSKVVFKGSGRSEMLAPEPQKTLSKATAVVQLQTAPRLKVHASGFKSAQDLKFSVFFDVFLS